MVNQKTSAFIIATVSFISWGAFVMYWHALTSINALEVIAHRAVWSLIFSAVLIIILRKGLEVKYVLSNPKYILPLVCSSLLIASNWFVFIWAVGHERIVEASMGSYIVPLMNVVISALVFKIWLNRYQFVAITFAFIGVSYMIYVYGRLPYVTILFAVTFCLYGIIKKFVPTGAIVGLFIETIVISIPALIYIIYTLIDGTSVLYRNDMGINLLLIFSGVITTPPLMGFSYSAKILHLSTIGILQYLTPTIAFLLGIFLYNEYFSRSLLIAFLFIWTGLLIYTLDGFRQLHNNRINR